MTLSISFSKRLNPKSQVCELYATKQLEPETSNRQNVKLLAYCDFRFAEGLEYSVPFSDEVTSEEPVDEKLLYSWVLLP